MSHLLYYTSVNARGAVAQLGERYNRTVEVKGSNPFSSTPIRLESAMSDLIQRNLTGWQETIE
jgi:hypothetical protein